MLNKMISELTRPQLLAILSDEEAVPTETLKAMVFVGLGGEPTPAATPAPAAPKAKAPKAKAPKAKAPKAAAPAAPAAAKPSPEAINVAIEAFATNQMGFAIADLATASGLSKGRCKTAVKNAMAAGTLFNAGDRRFSRYGATQAIAQAASDAARNGG